jgi:pentatricopeptide repeat protein
LSESASSRPSNHFDEDEDEDEDDEAEGNYNSAVLTEPLKSPTPASSSSPSMHAQDALEHEEHEEHEEYEAVATRASDGTVMLDTRKMMEELESELDADVPSEEDLGEDDIPLPGDLEAKLGQLSMGAASMDEQSLQQLMTGLHSDIHNIHSGRESPDSANHADTHTNAKAKSQPRSKNIQAQSVTAAREPGPERQIDEDEARKLESMLIIDSPNLDYNPDDLTLKSMKDPYAELRDEELNNLVKQRSRPEFSEAMNDILDLVDQDPYSLDPIDNPKNITMEALRDPDNPVNWDFVDQNWAMVYFGKAPEPNYEVEAMPLRRHRSIMKANMYMKEMLHRGIKPDVVTLTNYLSVYCESIRYVDEAKELFDKFEEMGVEPDQKTYRAMIRMYVRAKQPQEALLMKEQCIEKGIVPDAMSYGYLIDTLTNREMIVEAIKMLEEAADNGIKPPEKYVKKLRGRLRNLGVTHPNMPACPTQWAKDLMARRKLSAHNKSRRNIAPVQSKMFAGKKR